MYPVTLKVEHHFTFIELWEDIESSNYCLTRATEAMYQPLALQISRVGVLRPQYYVTFDHKTTFSYAT